MRFCIQNTSIVLCLLKIKWQEETNPLIDRDHRHLNRTFLTWVIFYQRKVTSVDFSFKMAILLIYQIKYRIEILEE